MPPGAGLAFWWKAAFLAHPTPAPPKNRLIKLPDRTFVAAKPTGGKLAVARPLRPLWRLSRLFPLVMREYEVQFVAGRSAEWPLCCHHRRRQHPAAAHAVPARTSSLACRPAAT